MAQSLYTFKLYVLLLYGMFGLTCLCLARIGDRRVVLDLGANRRIGTFCVVLFALPAMLLLMADVQRGISLVEAAVIVGVIFTISAGRKASPTLMIAGLSTGIITLSLVWWPTTTHGLGPLTAFTIVLAVFSFALSDPGRSIERFAVVPVAAFLVGGVALMIGLGPYLSSNFALLTLAHHWGAFLGPALQMKAGLVPFYDVPLQYGIGPSLTLAAACDGQDCWRGAQTIFTLFSLANGLLVLTMALTTTTPRGWVWQCAVTAVVFCSVFLWVGFPSEGSMFMATPSVTGIRYLPVTLVAHFLFFDRRRAATVTMIPAVLWSPESAAMSVAVFGFATTARLGFTKATALTAMLLVGSYAALFVVHRLVWGLWIDPLALLEYVLHVPGPLPIDPFGDIWLLATTVMLGGWLIYRPAPEPAAVRRDLVATVLLMAASTYFLGRSHPNNICILAPFLTLVATRVLDRAQPDFEVVCKLTALGLSVAVAALAFSPWKTTPFAVPVVLDIDNVVANFPSLQPDMQSLRAQIPETSRLGVAEFGPAMIRDPKETIWWTPMDPSSLWRFVPSARRQVYIQRSATRLRRSGWVIVLDRHRFLKNDLETAYTVSNLRESDGGMVEPGKPSLHYSIACLTPKASLVPVPIGPSCPDTKAENLGDPVKPNAKL